MPRATSLVEMRLSPQDEADLRWFYAESDGALGLKSTYPGMVAQLQLGAARRGTHSPSQLEVDDRLVAAATRARLISRALEACGRELAAVLRDAYGPLGPGEVELVPAFSELAGLVARTPAAVRLHRRARTTRSVAAWLARRALQARKGDPQAVQTVYEVRRDAEGLLVAASRAYVRRRLEGSRRGREGQGLLHRR